MKKLPLLTRNQRIIRRENTTKKASNEETILQEYMKNVNEVKKELNNKFSTKIKPNNQIKFKENKTWWDTITKLSIGYLFTSFNIFNNTNIWTKNISSNIKITNEETNDIRLFANDKIVVTQFLYNFQIMIKCNYSNLYLW